ncbi:MAG: hypothetical protein ACI311_06785 [Bacilli bacterium]
MIDLFKLLATTTETTEDVFEDPLLTLIKYILEKIAQFIQRLWKILFESVEFLFLLFFKYPSFFITLFLILWFSVDWIMRLYYSKKINDTEVICNYELDKTIYLVAGMGGGKTTLMAALCNTYSKLYMYKAHSVIEKTKAIIIECNWNDINKIIDKCYDEHLYFKDTVFVLKNKYPSIFNFKRKDYINNEVDYENLIIDYVEAYYALRQNNFVYSPAVTPILSRITNNYSRCLDPDWLKLKVSFDNNIFGLSRYSVIAEDEKATNQDKKESDYQNNAKVDDGIPEFFRLIRNAGKGTMTYITCNQDAARWVSVERHLMFTNLSIQNFEIKRTHRPLMMFYGLLNGIVKLIYKFIAFLHFNKVAKENFLNRENAFKKINRFFVEKDNKLFAKSIIVYTVHNYHDIDDLGKENTEANTYYKKLKLFFPITYAFGCIDTHIYAHIFDKLIESSKVSSFDVYSNRKDLTDEEKYNEMKRILDRSLKAKNKLNKTSGLSSNAGEVNTPDDDENLPSAF